MASRGCASRMRENRNNWSSTSSTCPSRSATFQQCLPRNVFDGVDQIGVGRPALGNRRPQHIERGVADLARHQPLDQPDPGCRVFGGHREIPGDDDLAVKQFRDRCQVIGEGGQPLLVEILRYRRRTDPAGRPTPVGWPSASSPPGDTGHLPPTAPLRRVRPGSDRRWPTAAPGRQRSCAPIPLPAARIRGRAPGEADGSAVHAADSTWRAPCALMRSASTSAWACICSAMRPASVWASSMTRSASALACFDGLAVGRGRLGQPLGGRRLNRPTVGAPRSCRAVISLRTGGTT